MRPDPHKKKYTGLKKKGGGRGTGRGADKEKPCKGPGGRRWEEDDQKGAQAAGQAAAGRGTPSQEDVTSQEDVDVPDQLQRKSYRRRKVESNWQRYEDLGEGTGSEPAVPRRGADFGELLKEAGDALSQFRFQDEMAWEEDEEEVHAQAADLMSLNCQDLSAALQCVPLHVRLGIQDIVPEYLIHHFETEAADHRATYKPARKEILPVSPPDQLTIQSSIADEVIDDIVPVFDLDTDADSQAKCDVATVSHTNKNNSSQDDSTSSKNSKTLSAEQEESRTKHEEHCKDVSMLSDEETKQRTDPCDTIIAKATKNTHNLDSEGANFSNSTVHNSDGVDDELDFLLGLDAPSKMSSNVGREGIIIAKQQPQTGPSIKSLEKVLNTSSSSSTSTSTKAEQTQRADDLEDWLDSVLED